VKTDAEYDREEREAAVRVLAAGMQSLLLSRPRMTPGYLLSSRPNGHVYFDVYVSWDAGRRKIARVTFVDPYFERVVFHSHRNGSWSQDWDKTPISQSEAERRAASIYTSPYTVQRVSDVALTYAGRLIEEALED